MSVADLGRRVSLSASSTADRLRRLGDGGVITGYAALLLPEALGYPITAFVRLKNPTGNYKPLRQLLPAPGHGPGEKARRTGYFRIQIHSQTFAGHRYLGTIEAHGHGHGGPCVPAVLNARLGRGHVSGDACHSVYRRCASITQSGRSGSHADIAGDRPPG